MQNWFPFPSLREIFRVLGLMKTDMVNFTLQSLRPHLLQQAVQYERAKFQQILDKQPGEERSLNLKPDCYSVSDRWWRWLCDCEMYGHYIFHFLIKKILTFVALMHRPAIFQLLIDWVKSWTANQ